MEFKVMVNNDPYPAIDKKKRIFIKIAIKPNIKEIWKQETGIGKKFSSMTALIKYCVNSYLSGELIEKSLFNLLSQDNAYYDLVRNITETKEQRDNLIEEIKKLKEAQYDLAEKLNDDSEETQLEKAKDKDTILATLSIYKANRTQLVNVLGKDEIYVNILLQDLETKQKLIIMDNAGFYHIK